MEMAVLLSPPDVIKKHNKFTDLLSSLFMKVQRSYFDQIFYFTCNFLQSLQLKKVIFNFLISLQVPQVDIERLQPNVVKKFAADTKNKSDIYKDPEDGFEDITMKGISSPFSLSFSYGRGS